MSVADLKFCACMGPQGLDAFCPCVMRQNGLAPSTPSWTDLDQARLNAFVEKMKERRAQD